MIVNCCEFLLFANYSNKRFIHIISFKPHNLMKPNTVNIPVDKREMRLRRVETLTQGYSVLLASSIDEWGK